MTLKKTMCSLYKSLYNVHSLFCPGSMSASRLMIAFKPETNCRHTVLTSVYMCMCMCVLKREKPSCYNGIDIINFIYIHERKKFSVTSDRSKIHPVNWHKYQDKWCVHALLNSKCTVWTLTGGVFINNIKMMNCELYNSWRKRYTNINIQRDLTGCKVCIYGFIFRMSEKYSPGQCSSCCIQTKHRLVLRNTERWEEKWLSESLNEYKCD